MSDTIRVFQSGKGTVSALSFENGVKRDRIVRPGAGRFLEESFASADDAESFCRNRLAADPSLILYILNGEEIERTVLDHDWQKASQRRATLRYGVISTIAIALVTGAASVGLMPFEHAWAHGVFVALMTGLYILLLLVSGNGSVEATVMMVILLVAVVSFARTLWRPAKPFRATTPAATETAPKR
jgi:hypothetical protein